MHPGVAPEILRTVRRPNVVAAVVLAAAIAFTLLDRPVIRTVSDWPAAVQVLFTWITELGHSAKYLYASAAAFLVFRFVVRRPRWSRAGALVFGAIFVPGVLINVLKVLIGRVRPHLLIEEQQWGFVPMTFDYDTSSMPSGHSSTIFGLALALSVLFPRWRMLWFGLAAVVALSRVITAAHYPSDVIVGAYIGLTFGAAWAKWLTRRERVCGQQPVFAGAGARD